MTDFILKAPGTVCIGLGLGLALLIAGCNYSGAPEGAKITTTGKATDIRSHDGGSTDYGGARRARLYRGARIPSMASPGTACITRRVDANGWPPPTDPSAGRAQRNGATISRCDRAPGASGGGIPAARRRA
jgi:hypothetical protein